MGNTKALEAIEPLYKLKDTDHKNAYQHAKNIMAEDEWPELGASLARGYLDLRTQLESMKIENAELADRLQDKRDQLAERDAQLAAERANTRDLARLVKMFCVYGYAKNIKEEAINYLKRKDLLGITLRVEATRQTTKEDLFKKHGIKYFDRDPMHDPWGWDGCKWYYSTPEQALKAKLEDASGQPTQDKGE